MEIPGTASEDEVARALAVRTGGQKLALLLDVRPTPADGLEALRQVFRLARVLGRAGRPARLGVWLCGAPTAVGSRAGAWKAVAREWAEAGHRVALKLIEAPEVSAQVLSLFERPGPSELRLEGDRVLAPSLRPRGPAGPRRDLGPNSSVLVVGGGRGIVARLARELAARAGCGLLVVGRTALSDPARGTALRETLDGLRAAGAREVSYRMADVARPEEARAVIRDARSRLGRLDLVILGAGIDRSRRLDAKLEAELEAVWAPKGGLAEALDAELGGVPVLAVTSVSGRFGNAGQIDYAAANDALARWTEARGGLAVDFSAWAEIGMAAPLARAMRERRVDPLPPDMAARAAVDLLLGGRSGEWVMAGRLGRRAEGAPFALEPALDVPGVEVVWRGTLVLDELAFLSDHRATQAGLLPGVVGIELMGAAALALGPEIEARVLEDVAFETPLKVPPNRPVAVEVRAGRPEGEAGRILAAIRTEGGLHHRAVIRVGGTPTDEPAPELADETTLGEGPDAARLYKTFFHGPSFQVLEATRVGGGYLVARSVPLREPLGRSLAEPARWRAMAREVAFQAAGAFLVVAEKRLALPVAVERLTRHADPTPGERVRAIARRRATGEDLRFDVWLTDERGRPLETLIGLAFRQLGKL
jgi:NAD(P)-dependent dehydrogenase (short-subunit alcohol dehydrogenase family)